MEENNIEGVNEVIETNNINENVETVSVVKKPKSNKVSLIIISAIVVIILVFSFIEVRNQRYKTSLSNAIIYMYNGSILSEKQCNKVLDVWHNSIWEKEDPETDIYTRKNEGKGEFYKDFNDALANYFDSEESNSREEEILLFLNDTNQITAGLSNPPKKYIYEYTKLMDLYESYINFTNLSLYCNGSYNSVSADFEKLRSEVSQKLVTMYIVIQ